MFLSNILVHIKPESTGECMQEIIVVCTIRTVLTKLEIGETP